MPPISLGIGLSLSMQGRGWRDYDLFETGSGFLYDFNRADTLFQETTGITPAGVDQNVGLTLDISKWGGKTLVQVLAGQAELKGSGATGMTGSSTPAQYNTSTGVGQLTRTSTGNHSYVAFTVGGGSYRIAVQNTGASGLLHIRSGGYAGTIVANNIGPGASATIILPSSSNLITLTGGTDGTTIPFVVSTFKEIPGNHASQATSGARPVLKAGGLTRYDGSDDNLLTTLVPSATMSLFARCKAPATLATTQVLIGGETATLNRAYLALFQNTGKLCGGAGAQGNATIVAANDLRGQILTIGMTIDTGSRVKLFENDVTVYDAAGGGSAASAIALRIGASNPSGVAANFFGADIYKALAINRALSPAEIVKLTNYWNTH